jgi:hypothetical protein
MADDLSILSFLRTSMNDALFRGTAGSTPASLKANQMVICCVLAALMAAVPFTHSLIAAVCSAKEVSQMMTEFFGVLLTPVSQSVSAIWCSCIAAGALPLSI